MRCHSSCLSQAGLQSHNSHFDCKQRAWPSVVGIWGWLIVRAGCWKLLLWQYFVLHRMPFHNVISSTLPQTYYAPFRRDLNSLSNDLLQLSYLQPSLLLHAELDWTEGKRNEVGIWEVCSSAVGIKTSAGLLHCSHFWAIQIRASSLLAFQNTFRCRFPEAVHHYGKRLNIFVFQKVWRV